MKKKFLTKKLNALPLIMILFISCFSASLANGEDESNNHVPLYADLKIEIIPDEGRLKCEILMNVDRSLIEDGKLAFELMSELEIKQILDDKGNPIPFERNDNTIIITIKEDLNKSIIPVKVFYEGIPPQRNQTYFSKDSCNISHLTTWYPFVNGFSGFYGKNTFIVPDHLVVASQGILSSQKSHNGKQEFFFNISRPTLYSFATARYEHMSKTIDGIEYATYFLSGGQKKADYYIKNAKPIINCLKKKYGFYPYDYFSIVEIPPAGSATFGGTSEQGLVYLPTRSAKDEYFNFSIIAHEIGHIWWGNWVRGYDFILSDGMAQLSNYLSAEQIFSEEIMRKYALYASFDHFASLIMYLTRFANPSVEEQNLITTKWSQDVYFVIAGKGPIVFLMLRDLLGEETFYKGIQTTMKKYAHKYLTLEQLKKEWEAAANTNLDNFFDQWVNKPGAPVLDLSWKVEKMESDYIVNGKIIQSRTPYFKMSIELEIRTHNDAETHIIAIEGKETLFSFSSKNEPLEVLLDPWKKSLWIGEKEIKRTQFAEALKVRMDHDKVIPALESMISKDPDDFLARAWLAFYDTRFQTFTDRSFESLKYIVKNANPYGEFEIYYSRACFELAKFYDHKGNREQAIKFYKKVLEVDRTGRFKLLVSRYLENPFSFK